MPATPISRRTATTLLAGAALAAALPAPAQTARPADWAQPVDLPGVPNLFRVTPRFYRSAQPDAAGLRQVPVALGIKTVINLRRRVDDAPLAEGSGLETLHIQITTRHITDDNGAAIVAALRAVTLAERGTGLLLHCTHGADRTGMITALWRMTVQNWPRQTALAEMTEGGFGFHPVWVNIVEYVQTVDIAALRARVAAG